ncbi:MAG: NYN domain-containing protein [Ruminococcus sp.]
MQHHSVIGILAHVDAGKTTLSESLLFQSGVIRKQGRVDHKDAFLDTDPLERERGITIFSKQAILPLPQVTITLLDTPGHIDFSAETERTLQVLDAAILVISGSDGVQSHTETLWQLLERYRVPVFLFLNKMDLAEDSEDNLLAQLQEKLSPHCLSFSQMDDKFYEAAALCSETALQQYLDSGSISKETLRTAIAKRELFPCCFGSALKQQGVERFLSLLEQYTPILPENTAFGAKVYKITEDGSGSRLTHMKITGGSLHVREKLSSGEKVTQIRLYHGTKFQTVETAETGMVCAVTGLTKTYAGEGLGKEHDTAHPVLSPVLSYRVNVPDNLDVHKVLENLKRLEQEDPQLQVRWKEPLQEISVRLMGEMQLAVLQRLMLERFSMPVSFDSGSIAYRETIREPVEGVGHYEPLRHYAEVHLLLEPLPIGSGLQFATTCKEDSLDRNWQRLVLTHLQEKTHCGVLTNSPITDMKITLVAGRAHVKHTEGGDFRQATYRALRQGLFSAESILLEPWYTFRLTLPTEQVGRAIADLQHMSATFSAPQAATPTMQVLQGTAPVSEMRTYQTDVTAYTKGKGKLFCQVKGYYPCHNTEAVLEQIGYDAEKDPENSGDSIFCSHGAGVLVKWNEVPAKMHVPYATAKKPEQEEKSVQLAQQASAYRSRLEEDKELLTWFERTYGKIKRDPRQALQTEREPVEQRPQKPLQQLKTGESYLLVDGYNVIHAWDSLKQYLPDHLDLARKQLSDWLCNYQGFRQCHVILVFDAYQVKGGREHVEQYHNIHIVYTKEAETADAYIERTTYELAKERRVRVVTSDGLEQRIILGNGACRVSAAEFEKEMAEIELAMKAFLQSGKLSGNHITMKQER